VRGDDKVIVLRSHGSRESHRWVPGRTADARSDRFMVTRKWLRKLTSGSSGTNQLAHEPTLSSGSRNFQNSSRPDLAREDRPSHKSPDPLSADTC